MPIQFAGDVLQSLLPKQQRGRVITPAMLRQAALKYRADHVKAGHGEYAAPLWEVHTPIFAYVNHGRWLVDCSCNNSPLVSDRSPQAEAPCLSCGAIWTNIKFPDDADAIEDALKLRNRSVNQNWTHGEAIADLHRENKEHPHQVKA